MKKVKLEKIDAHLNAELKNEEFRKNFELERAKVSLAQKIAELRQDKKLKLKLKLKISLISLNKT